MTTKFFGDPTTLRALQTTTDDFTADDLGGQVELGGAKSILNLGDFVYKGHDNKWTKRLGNSYYQAKPIGIVVGGQTQYDKVVLDSGAIGVQAAAAGERVLVMTRGVCYAIVDSANSIRKNDPISAGRTTAGRIRGDLLYSLATTAPGLAKDATNVVAEAVNATQIVVAGVAGTAVAAGTNMAALAGTVVNGTFNVWEFYVAANGSTVTSALGTAASTLDGVVFPAGQPSLATLGYVIIHPTGTGDFVGGTTSLADATVVPNAVYVDLVGSQYPLGHALEDGSAIAAGAAILVRLWG